MQKMDLQGLREVQLDILSAVADFCEKNGIHYWIDSGTLLGAIRHKGYIPWDDDIDIGMLRPDYERFLQLFNAENSRYRVCAYETDKEFLYPFGKVLDTKTVLYEPDENGIKLCVNIDIFVYDNAPDDDKAVKKMYDRRDFWQILHNLRNGLISEKGAGALKKIIIRCSGVVLRVFPKDVFVKKMVLNSKKCAGAETKRVGNFTAVSRIACDKSVFSSFIKSEFEGRYYAVPIGYDRWLKAFYGDYMQLPPVEKRVSHHEFKAYILD